MRVTRSTQCLRTWSDLVPISLLGSLSVFAVLLFAGMAYPADRGRVEPTADLGTNRIILDFNEQLSAEHPDFSALEKFTADMRVIDSEKADQMERLAESAKTLVSEEVVGAIESAIAAEDAARAQAQLRYLSVQQKSLGIPFETVVALEEKAQKLPKSSDDGGKGLKEAAREFEQALYQNRLGDAHRALAQLKERIKEIRRNLSRQQRKDYQQKVAALQKQLEEKEDSFIRINLRILETRGVEAAVEYRTLAIPQYGLSQQKLFELDEAIFVAQRNMKERADSLQFAEYEKGEGARQDSIEQERKERKQREEAEHRRMVEARQDSIETARVERARRDSIGSVRRKEDRVVRKEQEREQNLREEEDRERRRVAQEQQRQEQQRQEQAAKTEDVVPAGEPEDQRQEHALLDRHEPTPEPEGPDESATQDNVPEIKEANPVAEPPRSSFMDDPEWKRQNAFEVLIRIYQLLENGQTVSARSLFERNRADLSQYTEKEVYAALASVVEQSPAASEAVSQQASAGEKEDRTPEQQKLSLITKLLSRNRVVQAYNEFKTHKKILKKYMERKEYKALESRVSLAYKYYQDARK